MTRRKQNWLYGALIVLVPAGCAVWFSVYWPARQRRVLIATVEQALAGNDRAKAEQSVRQLLETVPDDPQVLLLHARVSRRSGKLREARSTLARARELGLPQRDADRESALITLAFCTKALLSLRKQRDVVREGALITTLHDFDNAEKTVLQLHNEEPADADVLEALAQGNAQRPQRWQQAEAFYTSLIELQPQRVELLLERARVLTDAKLYGKAASDFREYLRHFPDNFEVRLALADCLMNDAEMAKAEQELRTLDEERPGDAAVLTGLGICARVRGDRVESLALLRRAAEKNPSSSWILNEFGNTLLLVKRNDEAIAVFEKILVLERDDRTAHLKLAQALRQRNKNGDAPRIKLLEKRYQELEREYEEGQRAEANVRQPTPK